MISFIFYVIWVSSIPLDIYFQAINLGFGNVSFNDIFLLLSLYFKCLEKLFVQKFRIKVLSTWYYFGLIFIIFLAHFFTAFISISVKDGLRQACNILKVLLICWITIENFNSIDKFRKLYKYVTIPILLNALIIILNGIGITWITFGEDVGYSRHIGSFLIPFKRNAGLFDHYAACGMWFYLIVPFYVLNLFIKNNIIRSTILVSIFYMAIFITQSRSTWVAGIVIFILAGVLLNITQIRKSFYTKLVSFFLSISVVLCILIIKDFVNELIKMKELTALERLDQALFAFELFESNPLFGVGYGTFENLYGVSLHIAPMNILYSTGLMGIIPFLLLITTVVYNILKIVIVSHNEDIFLISGSILLSIISSQIEGLFASGIGMAQFWIPICLGIAFLVALRRNKNALGLKYEISLCF